MTNADRVHIMLNRAEEVVITPFPAPVVSSRTLPLTFPIPDPVLKLAEYAREHSWEVRVQYSQGHFPHATTGRPSVLKDVIGVRFGAHPVTDRQAYAIYARNAGPIASVNSSAWSWESFMVRGPDLPPARLYLLADLQAFLLMCHTCSAEGLASWCADVKIIHENGKALTKQRAKLRPARPKEGAR